MGNIGRVLCVALPFALTVASIIALLVAALAGVTDKSLYVFKLNTTDLSISASDVSKLLSSRSAELDLPTPVQARDFGSDIQSAADSTGSDLSSGFSGLISTASAAAASATAAADAATGLSSALSGTNITAADLGLADAYYVSLWNYCQESNNGTKTCKKAAYDWAANTTTSFEATVSSVASAMGQNITLPTDVKDALKVFGTVSRWTEIVFIIAFIALGVETLFGVFSPCSRMISCCTWIVAAFATIAVGAAAGLSTAMASVVVGAVEGTAKAYGVSGAFNTRYLATVWLAFAFALGASLTWIFTICCCAPDHRAKGRGAGGYGRTKHMDDSSSMMTGAGSYSPIGAGGNNAYGGAGYGHGGHGHGHDTSYQGHGAAADYYNNDKRAYEPMRHQQV